MGQTRVATGHPVLNVGFRVKRLLSRFGLELRRIPTAGAQRPDWLTHPVTADYLPGYRGTFVTEITIRDARGLHVRGLPFDMRHPFVAAATAGLTAPTEAAVDDRVRASLARDYDTFQPASALEVVGLSPDMAPGLADRPAQACLLPWSERTVDETLRGRAVAMREAGLQYGVTLSMEDGLTAFGPATPAKLDLETRRLVKLIRSVRADGFAPFDPAAPMKASALRAGNVLRWQIEEGHHRIPVAVAFGLQTVPVMVTQIIRQEEAEFWPRVADRTFTPDGATKIFDRIFAGGATDLDPAPDA